MTACVPSCATLARWCRHITITPWRSCPHSCRRANRACGRSISACPTPRRASRAREILRRLHRDVMTTPANEAAWPSKSDDVDGDPLDDESGSRRVLVDASNVAHATEGGEARLDNIELVQR